MADCYYLHSGVININYSDLPCEDVKEVGRNVTCCVRGSTCMSNGICQNPGGDGYYTADCTDPTLEDPACQTRCGGLAGAQITYNRTSSLWACCTYNGGQPNCSEPSNEIFPAPDPSRLKKVLYLPTTGTITYSTPPATSTSTVATRTSLSSSSSSSAIDPGATAGIGVGVGAGLILIAAVVAFFFLRRGNMSRKATIMPASSELRLQPMQGELENNPIISELESGQRHELGPNDNKEPDLALRVT